MTGRRLSMRRWRWGSLARRPKGRRNACRLIAARPVRSARAGFVVHRCPLPLAVPAVTGWRGFLIRPGLSHVHRVTAAIPLDLTCAL